MISSELNPSAALVLAEAKRRGIAVTTLTELHEPLSILELAGHHEFLYQHALNSFGRVTRLIFLHKGLTTLLLRRAKFPVPAEVFTDDLEEAKQFLAQHQQVVVKPFDQALGTGVTPGITTSDALGDAMKMARSYNSNQQETKVIVQEHVTGQEYRVLVINQQHVFVVHRMPGHVVGDGTSTVEALIKQHNAAAHPGRQIEINEALQMFLGEQHVTLTSVLPAGKKMQTARVANAHVGGTVHDVTDMIGSAASEQARAVARYFNVPIVGIDCITSDITQSLGAIIELNSAPDLTLHAEPTTGKPRHAAIAIVDMLFPETKSG